MTKKKKDQDISKDKPLIIGLVVIVLVFGMIFVSLRFTANQPNDTPDQEIIEYNGFYFTKTDGIWKTNMIIEDKFKGWKREYEFLFHYSPQEVENITTMRNSNNETIAPNLFLNAVTVYVTTDPEYPAEVVLGAVEIAKIMGQIYEKDVRAGITREYENAAFPVITCDDIGPGIRVIQLKIGNETSIKSVNGCVVVQGTTETEVVKASERLSYEMLGIL